MVMGPESEYKLGISAILNQENLGICVPVEWSPNTHLSSLSKLNRPKYLLFLHSPRFTD